MDFTEYQKRALETWGDQVPYELLDELRELGVPEERVKQVKLMGARLSMSVLGLGIAGESGEVADEVKKFVGHGHWKEGFDMEKEIGDVLWYAVMLCHMLDLDLEEVAKKNIAKLEVRYEKGFSTEASIARVDVKPKDPEQVERPPPIRDQVLDLINAKWPGDNRGAAGFLLRAQEAGAVRFSSSGSVYRFLRLMKDAGAKILPGDNPGHLTMGWCVWHPADDPRPLAINVSITLSDMKNSTDPRNSPSKHHWADLMVDAEVGGAHRITAERVRQQGHRYDYDSFHDDEHTDGALAHAAARLLYPEAVLEHAECPDTYTTPSWADELLERYKGDRERQLVVAGTLIAAELDRLQRTEGIEASELESPV